MTAGNPHSVSLEVIGRVSCAAKTVDDVPSEGLPSVVVIDPRYLPALRGISVGDHLYVITIFDQADPHQLSGSTGTENEQGAFSIRSSSRPNLLGMTLARVTAIDGASVAFDWLDFVDGSPVVDLKRYNWRWECVMSARRLDRRFIERQIDRSALEEVLHRAAVNFHGERCERTTQAATLAAALIQDHDVWLGDPSVVYEVRSDGHLIDALQGMTGATLGNGRLVLGPGDGPPRVRVLSAQDELSAMWDGRAWSIS